MNRVASWVAPSAAVLCRDCVGVPQLAHIPREGPGLQLPHKHRGASLHWLTAVIWLSVVVSVPVAPLLHCKIRQREINTSGLRTIIAVITILPQCHNMLVDHSDQT